MCEHEHVQALAGVISPGSLPDCVQGRPPLKPCCWQLGLTLMTGGGWAKRRRFCVKSSTRNVADMMTSLSGMFLCEVGRTATMAAGVCMGVGGVQPSYHPRLHSLEC